MRSILNSLLIASLAIVWISIFIQNKTFGNLFSRSDDKSRGETGSDTGSSRTRIRETYHKIVDSKKDDPSDSFRIRKAYHDLVDKKPNPKANQQSGAGWNIGGNNNNDQNKPVQPGWNIGGNNNNNNQNKPAQPGWNIGGDNNNNNQNKPAQPGWNIGGSNNNDQNKPVQPGWNIGGNNNNNNQNKPAQPGWNIGGSNSNDQKTGSRYSGVNKLKSLATLIKSNPDYGSSASYHNKRPGYFYHFNSRPDRYSQIEGDICHNDQNFDGIIYGQIKCPMYGYDYDETACCGTYNNQYCCKPFTNRHGGKSNIGFAAGLFFILIVMTALCCCTVCFCLYKFVLQNDKQTQTKTTEIKATPEEKSELKKDEESNTENKPPEY